MKQYVELICESNSLQERIKDLEGDISYYKDDPDKRNHLKNELSDSRLKISNLRDNLKTNHDKRVLKEIKRVKKIYKELDSDTLSIAVSLVERASFMRIQLENFEYDISVNGSTEPFSQGDQQPYDRARPVVQQYATMNANYQKIVKQLTDLLPKTIPASDTSAIADAVYGKPK